MKAEERFFFKKKFPSFLISLHSALDNWIERIEFENWLLFYL